MTKQSVRRRYSASHWRLAISLAVAVSIGSCGDAAQDQTSAWCEQVKKGAEILKTVEDDGGDVANVEPDVAREFGTVIEEIKTIGWPSELSDEFKVFEQGPQFPGSAEDREYDQALDRAGDFMRRECELSERESKLFFGS